ncbi:MAG: hypothetical protein RJA07_1976 [Bacteroidota bacterium]|jgi:tetratricopeptide (TPR) repeat protein
MKKITTLIITALFSMTVFGQTATETIKKANDLIDNKKYESAFKLLDSFDPKNGIPDIVLLKEDIALKYFVTSMMHQMFAFKDLEKKEDIMDYRGKEGSFGMQIFAVDKILDSLIKIYPNNCKLYKGLGDFYFEVYNKYGGNWLKDNNELFKLIEANNTKAVEGNCADYLSYYVLGYVFISQEKYKEGIPYFLKSIEAKKDFADAHYNLAFAYLYSDDKENALKYAKNSLELYKDASLRSDAARMIGQIYSELKDDKNAIKNLELANQIDGGNYYNIKSLLGCYLKTGNEKINETTKTFFNLAPTKPTIYNDLDEMYSINKKENDLATFYKDELIAFKDDNKVMGNLNFYLGKLYLTLDKKQAKEYFTKAKEIFNKLYDKDHPVFNAIEDGIKQTEN